MRSRRVPRILSGRDPRIVVGMCLFIAGCASSPLSLPWSQTSFPAQKVIENGDYKGFLAANQRTLARCGVETGCDVTLFNLGFVYAFPSSPYRDPQKARRYLNELHSRYPHSPWATQGQVLLRFMHEQGRAEEAQRRLRAELRTRDTVIRKLREQLNRSREIDIEMERMERELLR
jgi:hypothetical protein